MWRPNWFYSCRLQEHKSYTDTNTEGILTINIILRGIPILPFFLFFIFCLFCFCVAYLSLTHIRLERQLLLRRRPLQTCLQVAKSNSARLGQVAQRFLRQAQRLDHAENIQHTVRFCGKSRATRSGGVLTPRAYPHRRYGLVGIQIDRCRRDHTFAFYGRLIELNRYNNNNNENIQWAGRSIFTRPLEG